jgi:hypothetical protein
VKDTEAYHNLEKSDRILFESRAQPLKVEEVGEDQIMIEGPSGGEYILFVAEEKDRVLISKDGSRDYASYVDNLRKVGEWEKIDENRWKHSKSDSELKIERTETDYWTIKTDDFKLEEEIDLPLYGYSDHEFAEEDVKKFINKHPEG